MLLIHCPYCDDTLPELEFAYAGEAHIARPADPMSLSDEEWRDFLADVAELGMTIEVTELDVNDARLPATEGVRDAAVAHIDLRRLHQPLAGVVMPSGQTAHE